jgi:hypothetical protein
MESFNQILIDYKLPWHYDLLLQVTIVIVLVFLAASTAEKTKCTENFCCKSNRQLYTFDANKLPYGISYLVKTVLRIDKFTACKLHFIKKMSIAIGNIVFVTIAMLTRKTFLTGLLGSTTSYLQSLGFKMLYGTVVAMGLGSRNKVSLISTSIGIAIKEIFSDGLDLISIVDLKPMYKLNANLPFSKSFIHPHIISPRLKAFITVALGKIGLTDKIIKNKRDQNSLIPENITESKLDREIKESISDLSMCDNDEDFKHSTTKCYNQEYKNNSIFNIDITEDNEFMDLLQDVYENSIASRIKQKHINISSISNRKSSMRTSTIKQRISKKSPTQNQKQQEFEEMSIYPKDRRPNKKHSSSPTDAQALNEEKKSHFTYKYSNYPLLNQHKSSNKKSSTKHSSPKKSNTKHFSPKKSGSSSNHKPSCIGKCLKRWPFKFSKRRKIIKSKSKKRMVFGRKRYKSKSKKRMVFGRKRYKSKSKKRIVSDRKRY